VITKIKTLSLINIQYLRAIAALMVVWSHAREQVEWLKIQFPLNFGVSGVDLFFVISGFIMVYTTHDKKISPLQFFSRRLERIVPLYWTATIGVVCVAMIAPALLRSTALSLPHILASLTFVPMLSPVFPDRYWPLVIPGWTLNYEMAFYLIFAMTLLTSGIWRLLSLGAALVSIVVLGSLFSWQGILGFYSDSIVLIFLFGSCIGFLYTSGRIKKKLLLGSILSLTGIIIWLFAQHYPTGNRVIDAGIPATLIVAGFCLLPNFFKNQLKWLGMLGDASYSIYLSHVFVLAFLRNVFKKAGMQINSDASGWVYMFFNLILCAIIGWLIYTFVENFYTRRIAHWRKSSNHPPSSATT
jgi:exopolysaccharide production protein ExoZ